MDRREIYSAAGLTAYIQEVGFLPLLTTPEALLGREACLSTHTPEESYARLTSHLKKILPGATDKQIRKLVG